MFKSDNNSLFCGINEKHIGVKIRQNYEPEDDYHYYGSYYLAFQSVEPEDEVLDMKNV